MLSLRSVLYTLASINSLTYGLRSGAPFCSVDVAKIQSAHGPGGPDPGYSLEIDESSENSASISIKGRNSWQGLLIYVYGQDEKVHLGSFDLSGNGLKFQTVSACSGDNTKITEKSTVTHSDASNKDVKLTWKPLPGDEAKGPFKVKALVTLGTSPWQVLEKTLELKKNVGEPTQTSTAVVSATPQSQAGQTQPIVPRPQPSTETASHYPGKRKCHRKKAYAQKSGGNTGDKQLMKMIVGSDW
jgi:hypothetical protein